MVAFLHVSRMMRYWRVRARLTVESQSGVFIFSVTHRSDDEVVLHGKVHCEQGCLNADADDQVDPGGECCFVAKMRDYCTEMGKNPKNLTTLRSSLEEQKLAFVRTSAAWLVDRLDKTSHYKHVSEGVEAHEYPCLDNG